jgi:hypothetical protein
MLLPAFVVVPRAESKHRLDSRQEAEDGHFRRGPARAGAPLRAPGGGVIIIIIIIIIIITIIIIIIIIIIIVIIIIIIIIIVVVVVVVVIIVINNIIVIITIIIIIIIIIVLLLLLITPHPLASPHQLTQLMPPMSPSCKNCRIVRNTKPLTAVTRYRRTAAISLSPSAAYKLRVSRMSMHIAELMMVRNTAVTQHSPATAAISHLVLHTNLRLSIMYVHMAAAKGSGTRCSWQSPTP